MPSTPMKVLDLFSGIGGFSLGLERAGMGKVCKISGCKKAIKARGWCAKHYTRWQRYGDPEAVFSIRTEVAIKFVVDAVASQTDDCIHWPYVTNNYGYGALIYGGGTVGSHRLVLSLATGVPLSDSRLAIHGPCNNRACINPRHLRWGTHKENTFDMIRDGTQGIGSRNSNAILNERRAREIFCDQDMGVNIARRYGVSRSTVSQIKLRKAWKHATESCK